MHALHQVRASPPATSAQAGEPARLRAEASASSARQQSSGHSFAQVAVGAPIQRTTESMHRELEALRGQRRVSSALGRLGPSVPGAVPNKPRVGITFRTDSSGKVHEEWDKVSVGATRAPTGGLSPSTHTLPHGASGGETPTRDFDPRHLDDVDALYVPGAPVAADSQKAANRSRAPRKDREFNRVSEESVAKARRLAVSTNTKWQAATAELNSHKKKETPLPRSHGSPATVSELAYARDVLRRVGEHGVNAKEHLDALPKVGEPWQRKSLNQLRQEVQRGLTEAARNAKTERDGAAKAQTKETRLLTEHQSRSSYEVKALREAYRRGMPTLAVCAGMWRLLEAHGGEVETLPEQERNAHKSRDMQKVWQHSHPIEALPNTHVGDTIGGRRRIPDVNSTHWAAASESRPGLLSQRDDQRGLKSRPEDPDRDPNAVFRVSARAPGFGPRPPVSGTVEAIEGKHGAPMFGLQWHPEGYNPGMPSEDRSPTARTEFAQKFMSQFAQAATAYRHKRGMLTEMKGLHREMAQTERLREEAHKARSTNFWGR